MSGSSNYQLFGVKILRLFFHYCHKDRGLFCMLLYWGDFDLSRLKNFSFSWNKFCIFPESISFWYAVIFRLPEPPSNIYCTELPFVYEQGEQSGLLGQYVGRERLGKREKAGFAYWWRTEIGKVRRR